MTTAQLLKIIAFLEAATGAMLLSWPSLVSRALFDSAMSGAGTSLARVAGAALVGLGVACWPSPTREASTAALRGMLTYSSLVAVVLVWSGLAQVTGKLLWPAVVAHLAISFVLIAARSKDGIRAAAPPGD